MTFVKWNRKSVSVICRVTWFIIRPTIWNEFDIVCIKLWAFFFFLQILHAISKVQLCCSIFSAKAFSKLVPSLGEVVWPFGNFFVSFLCLRLFNISSICSWDVFDPVKCKADFFATAFHCCLLISHSLFCDVSHLRSFYPHYRHEQSHCVHLKVLQVNSGFLLPLSLLKYFISRANWSLLSHYHFH